MNNGTNKQSLGKNTLWSLSGHMINGAGRMLLFVLAARFFPPEQTGIFFWSLAVVTPLIYFFNLELRLSYVTDSSGKFSAGDMIGMRLLGNTIAMILITCFALFMGHKAGTLTATLLILCGLTRTTEAIADSFIGVIQKKEKMRQAAISFICRTSIIIVLTILAGYNQWPIWTIPLIWIIAVALVNRCYEAAIARDLADIRVRFDKSRLKQIFRESLPLGTFMAVATLNTEAGKYFIKHYLSNADVAYYSIAITIINGTMMTQNGINQGVLRRLSIFYHVDKKQFLGLFYKVLSGATIIMTSVIWLFWGFGREIIATLVRPEYSQNLFDKGPVLMIMLGGGLLIIWAMVIGDAVVACREFTGRMTSMLVSLVTNLFLCYYLVAVKDMQLTGIAWAFTCSAAANLIVNLYYLVKLMEPSENERR